MVREIKNPGSAPIYRKIEELLNLCLTAEERTPNSVGVMEVCKRLTNSLLDSQVYVGMALNEDDLNLRLELLNSVHLQMRTVKTCIDTLQEWSSRSGRTRFISRRQQGNFGECLKDISDQLRAWRSKTWGMIKQPDS